MLLADVDWMTLASDKGLAVAIVVAGMFALWRTVAFCGPLAKEYVSSTCSLCDCLKETSIKQTALMDDHSGKLSAIREALTSNRCPMIGADTRDMRADARDMRADSRDSRADARDDRADLRSHDANFPLHLPHGVNP